MYLPLAQIQARMLQMRWMRYIKLYIFYTWWCVVISEFTVSDDVCFWYAFYLSTGWLVYITRLINSLWWLPSLIFGSRIQDKTMVQEPQPKIKVTFSLVVQQQYRADHRTLHVYCFMSLSQNSNLISQKTT